MRLIIAGGRSQHLEDHHLAELNLIKDVSCVLSGGATGVDSDGETWARNNNIPVKIYSPDWDNHGKLAGPLRNREMATNADALALFPGGKGTDSMLNEAKKAGLKIFDFRPHAQLELDFQGDDSEH